jgi:uncharacterized protein YkwD
MTVIMGKAPILWIVTQRIATRRRGWRWPAFASQLLLVLLLAPSASAASRAKPVRSSHGTRPPEAAARANASHAEREILELVNRERRARGLRPLVADQGLAEAALQHSRRMAELHTVTHQFPDEARYSRRLARVGLRFDASGENVAFADDSAQAHNALMHSPGHRANILDRDFTSAGIGVVATARGIYVTQDFAHLLPKAGVEEAEEIVARSLNQLRRSAGEPALRRIPAPVLRRRACEMAERDRVNPRDGAISGANGVIAFTASDLNRIPQSIGSLRNRPARGFSVGACYRASRSYDDPVFWVLLVTYR